MYDGSENFQHEQIYMGSSPVAYVADPVSGYPGYPNAYVRYQITDLIGSVWWSTDFTVSGGAFTQDAFGNNPTSAGADDDPLHFAGLDRDGDGTNHAQFRNYIPAMGRWSSPDPYMGSYSNAPQSLNRYSYVSNNPLASIDPSGLWGYCVSTSYNQYTRSYTDDEGVLHVDNVFLPNDDGYCEDFGGGDSALRIG